MRLIYRREIMKKRFMAGLALCILALIQTPAQTAATPALRFEITIRQGLVSSPQNGRLFVIMNRSSQPEPRLTAGTTGIDASPILGRDINNFAPSVVAVIDERAARFPIQDLADLPAGDYFVQALFDSNIDLNSINSPGNLYSAPQKVHLDPARGAVVKLELTEKIPPEELPA